MLFLALLAVGGLRSTEIPAQPGAQVHGDFVGLPGSLHLKLHILASADGSLTCTLDSPDETAIRMACADAHIDGQNLLFTVPSIIASWSGKIESDGSTLIGTWAQESPTSLVSTRDTFVAVDRASAVDGFWLGTLQLTAEQRLPCSA